MFKNKIDKYLRRVGYTQMKKFVTLDKPVASLSTCHLGICLGMEIFINGKSVNCHRNCESYRYYGQMVFLTDQEKRATD